MIFDAPRDELELSWQREAGRGRIEEKIRPAWVADDLTTLISAARAGAGIVLAPDFAVRDALAAGTLVDVLPGWHLLLPLGATVQALTLPLAVAPESARSLVRFVREALDAAAVSIDQQTRAGASQAEEQARRAPIGD